MATALGGYPLDVAINPANLTVHQKKSYEIGVFFPYLRIHYQDSMNDQNPEYAYTNSVRTKTPVSLPHFGLSIPLSKKLYFGSSLYPLGGAGLEMKGIKRLVPNGDSMNQWAGVNLPLTGSLKQITESIFARFFVFKFTNALAWKIGRLSIGAGIEANYANQYTRYEYRDLSGKFLIPGKGFEYRSSHAFSPGFIGGITFRFTENFRAAYSYQARGSLPLNGRVRFNLDRPDWFYLQSGSSYKFKLPERHTIGIAYLKNAWTFVLDAAYLNFSTTNSTVKQILEFPLLETPLGYTNQMNSNLRAKDSLAAGTGFAYKPENIAYRMGFSYSTVIAGEDGIAPVYAGLLHSKIFMAGLGIEIKNFEINIAYNHLFLERVKGNDLSDWDLSHAM
ncbi:MAG: outer membrane protein transport protein, partial [Spirochaetia bacterium]|nr:outer membrane protein transport protein [Spirochaetia bacterium]